MKNFEAVYYTKEHEWIGVEKNIGYVGITSFSRKRYGEISYFEVPEIGENFEQGDSFIIIEFERVALEVNLPIGGKVLEINSEFEENPDKINEEAESIWIVKIEISDIDQLDELMDEGQYNDYVNTI